MPTKQPLNRSSLMVASHPPTGWRRDTRFTGPRKVRQENLLFSLALINFSPSLSSSTQSAGGSRTFPQGFTGYRSSFKPGWAPSGTKVETGEYFAQPEFRNVFEKMLSRNPLRWSGERSFLKETPKSFDRPLEFLNTGKALKLRKVLDTGKLTPDELRRAQIELMRSLNIPERGTTTPLLRGENFPRKMLNVFRGKKDPKKLYMMEEAAASEKQMDWGRRVQEMIDDLHKQYDRTGRPLTKKQKMGNF